MKGVKERFPRVFTSPVINFRDGIKKERFSLRKKETSIVELGANVADPLQHEESEVVNPLSRLDGRSN